MEEGEIMGESSIVAFLDGPDDPREIHNRIHSSEGAKQFGFKAPLVGGVTVYSWACPVILKILGEGWLDNGWIDFQLRKPVHPGDHITIKVFKKSKESQEYSLFMKNQTGELCVKGSLGMGESPWLNQLSKPQLLQKTQSFRPRLTVDTAPIGRDIPSKPAFISSDSSRYFAKYLAKDDNPLWHEGENPVVHPALLAARMTILLEYSMEHLPAIHTRSQIQHLKRVKSNQNITTLGHFVEVKEWKGNHYAVVDGTILSQAGEELCRLRHTTIFQIRSSL